MSFGEPKIYTVSMASDATLSSQIPIGAAYQNFALVIPTMTSGTDVYIQGATTDGGTFRRIYYKATGSAPVACHVGSAVSQAFVNLNANLPGYVKIELSTAMTATPATFNIVCWN